jgi:UPF0755 protein
MSKRKLALAFILSVVFVVGVPTFVGMLLWVRMTDLYRGYTAVEQFVEVPQGAGSAEIARQLVDAGIVKDTCPSAPALWWTGDARKLKAGEYRFDRPISALDVIGKLARGTSTAAA